MRKLSLATVGLVLTCLGLFAEGHAQTTPVSRREAEWKSYALPAADFVRRVDSSGTVLFRVPANWKQEEPSTGQQEEKRYRFIGPHSSLLQVSVQKIPDGLPLQDYLAAILRQLRNLPGSADSQIVRHTELSGLEAREILFELPDENGNLSRRLIWCAVGGPTAVAIVLIEPADLTAEIEPSFRAVVQSAMILEKDKYAAFAALRRAAIKEEKPTRIDEVQSIIATVNGLDAPARTAALAKLGSIFSTVPDSAVDLLLDRRPLVRAAALEAIANSKNRLLDALLLNALHDEDVFVSDRAARAVATMPDIVATLRRESFDWISPEITGRVWPYLNKSARLQILAEGFAARDQLVVRRATPGGRSSAAVTERTDADPSGQMSLLVLMNSVPVEDFKLPLAQILRAKNDVLTAGALQVALERHESLAVAELFKLLSSAAVEGQRLAARNLGESATVANIAQIEDFAKRIEAPPPIAQPIAQPISTPANSQQSAQNKRLAEELRIAIKKIRLREALGHATTDSRPQLLKEALTDPVLADWVWSRYVREEKPLPTAGSDPKRNNSLAQISALGANAFPERVGRYVAIPEPASLFRKFGESLNSIQMDSARTQANLVLVLYTLHGQLARQLAAPADQAVFEYSGIKITEPIAMAQWTASGAPPGLASAQRKAIVLGVADRYRFERSLTLYQKQIGNFASLPDYLSVGARFLGALPVILPISAEMLLKERPEEKKEAPVLNYGFSGETDLDGYTVKLITQRRVSAQGTITNDTACLMYFGDVALLTPDLDSLRDVLQRMQNGGPTLAANNQFKSALASGGDAVYLSNLQELFSASDANPGPPIKETGSLKISNTSWESAHHLTFSESDWGKPLVSFPPGELSAPHDLLPRSTVVYYFMKIDGAAALQDWGKELSGAASLKSFAAAWAIDFEKEVLPELGPECGAAVLALPDVTGSEWQAPLAVFFKLKSDKLQRAFTEGRLFKNSSEHGNFIKLQWGSADFFVTIKSGFLIAASSATVLPLLDQKEKLAASPDFAKAVKRTPAGVVAFGGYNLEATNALRTLTADSVKAQQAEMILSLTRAFHSPSFFATTSRGSIDARSSVSMDREGRYSIAELQSLTVNSELTFAVLEPTGIPIVNQSRIKSLGLRIHARAAGEIERIAEDVASATQTVDQRSEQELRLKVLPRRTEPKERVALPITTPALARFLEPTKEIRSDEKSVIEKAREIAGADRDAWSVARKLSDWTYKNLTWKRVDDADAAQTLATREADCYEFSKLYVAMARSLGLPARVVSGLAYSGSAFGGHAWVEVYAGSWIEIDPTWGTDFVDATHVKDSSGALLTYAALNLVQLEVLEAPRAVEDFQLDANALAKKLNEELPKGQSAALDAALDMAVLTDEVMGEGTWSAMTDAERSQISAAYPRVVSEITSWLKKDELPDGGLRLLTVKVHGNRAEALLMQSTIDGEMLVRLNLLQRAGAWLLADMVQTDTGLRVISEMLLPTISEIREQRSGKKSGAAGQTDFARVLVASDRDPQNAIKLADRALKNNPKDRGLRYLKSLALVRAKSPEEAVKLWTELSAEPQPLAVAILSLAAHYEHSKEEADRKKAIELYARYLALEPDDPRAHTGLATLYEGAGDYVSAETEYRAAIERDSSNTDVYLGLAVFYCTRKRFSEAVPVLDEAAKRTGTKDDLLATLISSFWFEDKTDLPEGLAASYPQRMSRSALANLNLARIRLNHEHPREALPLLRKAAALDQKSPGPYTAMAEAHRKLREWIAALNAADTAIRLSSKDGDAHFQRACALARLGRRAAALASLKRAIELDEEISYLLDEEEDLKPLAAMAEFKKLLPKDPEQ